VAPAAEPLTRKTVTVVFCDVVGSTSLGEQIDPETNRRVILRYFEEARLLLEGRGGTVEKFIGDAVMAVFGVPTVHEDDALRAVGAAEALRTRLELLNNELQERWGVRLEWRMGINTGEVVVGDPSSTQTIGSGDTFNVAARLQQAAQPGEILLGRETYRLVRDAVVAGPLHTFPLKGKAAEVQTRALEELRVGTAELERRLSSPIVGRDDELAALRAVYERTLAESSCRLVTIVGQPGIGKTRLARELIAQVLEARVVTGRCLPYGEGITFSPVVEIVRGLAGIRGDDSPAAARRRLSDLVAGMDDRAVIESRLAGLLELGEPARTEELFWALRRLFESLARAQPLVLVVEDVHWGESALLDLIEYLVGWTVGVQLLIVCLARPDIVEKRAAWTMSDEKATAISLEPLRDEHVAALISNALGEGELQPELAAYVADASGGNPLFAEELIRILVEDGVLRRENDCWSAVGALSDVAIPPTITALLAARLDRLDPDERLVLQCASVVGKEFWGGAVAALATDAEVGAALHALVRKRLVVPSREASFIGEDAFAFAHALIRDVAYTTLAKSARAELHERIAGWLGGKVGPRVDAYSEIIGYHLEQAAKARLELSPASERGAALAEAAAGHLAAAGRRALATGNMHAAARFLLRARDLLPAGDRVRPAFAPELGEALRLADDVHRAEQLLVDAEVAARSVGDRQLASRVAVELAHLRTERGTARRDEVERDARDAIVVFEELGDATGLARAWHLLGFLQFSQSQFAATEEHLSRGLTYAERAGDRRHRTSLQLALACAAFYGPTPVGDAIELCDRMVEDSEGDQILEGAAALILGALNAMACRFAPARSLTARGVSIFSELGLELRLALAREFTVVVPLLAGDLDAAERELRLACDVAARLDAKEQLPFVHGMLADVLCRKGRYGEAEAFVREAKEAAAGDVFAEATWRRAAAKFDAARGDVDQAAAMLYEAGAIVRDTDALALQADVQADLAGVLARLGRNERASQAVDAAGALYRRKEHAAALAQLASTFAPVRNGLTS
jgi:class 3 adenylate cyclase/tetratricopeptide (TPR) repeat protein